MLIKHAAEVEKKPAQAGISIQWLLAQADGAPNFAMRIIEIQPDVVFAPHQHPFEHEIYVLEGVGILTDAQGDVDTLSPGKFLLVQPDEMHGYRNTGATPLKFICVIPHPKS